MTSKRLTRPVHLECGHKRWFAFGVQLPRTGENIWCPNCAEYMIVGVPLQDETLGFFPDYAWSCRRKTKLYYGKCETPECGYESRDGDYFKLKPRMELHHIHAHSSSSLVSARATVVDQPLPRNSPPPF